MLHWMLRLVAIAMETFQLFRHCLLMLTTRRLPMLAHLTLAVRRCLWQYLETYLSHLFRNYRSTCRVIKPAITPLDLRTHQIEFIATVELTSHLAGRVKA